MTAEGMGREGGRVTALQASAIGRLLAASNGAAAALVTRKNPQKEIPNEKSALRIGRGGAKTVPLSLSLSLSLPELRGGQDSSARDNISHPLCRRLTFTIGRVYNDEAEGRDEGAREFSLKTV